MLDLYQFSFKYVRNIIPAHLDLSALSYLNDKKWNKIALEIFHLEMSAWFRIMKTPCNIKNGNYIQIIIFLSLQQLKIVSIMVELFSQF